MKKAILISITIGSIILLFGYYNLMHRDNTNFEGDSTFIYINSSDSIVSILDTISKQILADSVSLLKAFLENSFLENNGFNEMNSMSIYIPNSYEFFWNVEPNKFRNRMLEEYNYFWNEDRTKKAKSIDLSKKEVIVLASIVQKESIKLDERPIIAGVYLNRLRKKMRLQADPTVIYSIKSYYNNFDTIIRRVLYRDLKLESPYNTYKIKGLPPGPISMPDISSIDAVLNSRSHDYIFFVADPYNPGYHLFASTLRQHNKNRRVYTRWLNSKKIYR